MGPLVRRSSIAALFAARCPPFNRDWAEEGLRQAGQLVGNFAVEDFFQPVDCPRGSDAVQDPVVAQ